MSRLRPLLDLRILGHTSGVISLCDDDQKPRISTVSGIKLELRNVKSIIEEGSSPVPLENLEMFEGTGIILLSFSLQCSVLLRQFSLLCPRSSVRVLPSSWRTWRYATKSACFSAPRESVRN